MRKDINAFVVYIFNKIKDYNNITQFFKDKYKLLIEIVLNTIMLNYRKNKLNNKEYLVYER